MTAVAGLRVGRPRQAHWRLQVCYSSVFLWLRRGQRRLKVLALLAALRTEFFQYRELFSCLSQVAGLHVELAQVLMRTLVIGVEIQRFLVVGERSRVVARLAQAEPHQAVDIGMLMRVRQRP